MSFSLFDRDGGALVAPAGCGKTQAIVDALAAGDGPRALVLTHTNAGVAALRARLSRSRVPGQRYRLSTLDGWSLRVASAFPTLSGLPAFADGRISYPAVQQAALRAISGSALAGPLRATYGRLIVDEYQDCGREQHELVLALAARLPTYVLGDPLQLVFDFRAATHPDWAADVEGAFGRAEELTTPWRWINAGEAAFGKWVLSLRPALLAERSIDLRNAPPNVTWLQLPADAAARQAAQAQAIHRIRTGAGLLVIGDPRDRRSRAQFARGVPGLSVVEPVDLNDLLEAASAIEMARGVRRLQATLNFAAEVMTGVSVRELGERLNSLQSGSARSPADAVETEALRFAREDGMVVVRDVLKALAASPRRTFRHHLLAAMMDALARVVRRPGLSLVDAAVASREERRASGRPVSGRVVGSTLLLKGLESDHAVILDAGKMNARHFYVAVSRASVSLTIFSSSPILTFR